jgi:protein-S-isoprenylcysteine O-methyltransferase Ste14
MLSNSRKILHFQSECFSCSIKLDDAELNVTLAQVSIRRAHRLITGPFPYDVIRHPSYTGLILMVCGVIIRLVSPGNTLHFPHLNRLQKHLASMARRWIATRLDISLSADTVTNVGYSVFVAIILAGQMRLINARVRVEEKALREEFGEEYDRYCARTWKYLPGW